MNLFKTTLLATVVAAAGFAGTAMAASPLTDTFEVRIEIQETCEVLIASDIVFDATIPEPGTVEQEGEIAVECTNGTAYSLSLNEGASGNRHMAGPSSQEIAYELYQDSARTPVWGTDADNKHVTGEGEGLGSAYRIVHDVYAVAPLVGNEEPGDYSDVATATLTF
ncbi:spore coat U domain-containing protein [Pseudoxanthomonas sp. J35]|uniref:Csu type fimbrial protein n=1 Tax=Pseudoxanthomonas sp. J35 TaxID=935852 RepID=UPI0004AF2C70|nr:spore coat U domain-containing protein [Pseudoxanthomonas sp. J35]